MPKCNCHGGDHCCANLPEPHPGKVSVEEWELFDPGVFAESREMVEEGDDEDLGPLSEETIKALMEAGINLPDWQPEVVSEGDATHILAFHKFLCAGEWKLTEEGEKIFMVDQASFDYATGKISSAEYMEAPEGEKVPSCPECNRDLRGYAGPLCRYCDGTAE